MIKTKLCLCINEPLWKKELTTVQKLAEHVVSVSVNYINQNDPLDLFSFRKPLAFNLCLSNDEEIQALNKEFRQKDSPTNILSFANIDDPDFINQPPENDIEMGDMIIALETMQREAAMQAVSLHDHFCHLLTHGVLHLLGYDHIKENDAKQMENLEIQILECLNIDNPYKENP